MKKMIKTITVSISAVLMLLPLAAVSYADGSYSVDSTYLQLKPGETGTIVISADNAAGRVNWSSEGAIKEEGAAWLDNGVQTIQFTAGEEGTSYIYVRPDPDSGIATYDNEVLDYGYTIQVDVVGDTPAAEPAAPAENEQDNAGNNEQPAAPENAEQTPAETREEQTETQTETQAETQTDTQEVTEQALMAAADEGTVLTDQNTDYEGLSDEDRLYTTVDGQELYIIQYPLWGDENGGTVWNDEVFNLDRLTGFDYGKVNYKGLEVDVFTYKDFPAVFVLKNLETDVSQYYTLQNNAEGFMPLPYVTVNGRQYIVEEFPSDFTVPEGYSMIEMTLGASTVPALKATVEKPELKGYNVSVSPGLESTDPTADLYYIYCLVDGATQLYSYDSGEGTLQRASLLVYDEVYVEPETVVVYETAPETQAAETVVENQPIEWQGWSKLPMQVKALLIALAVAIILIIILIIAFAVMSHRNSKNRKAYLNIVKNRPRRSRSGGRNSQNPPPRSENNGNEDSMFSYVKTDSNEFDINDMN